MSIVRICFTALLTGCVAISSAYAASPQPSATSETPAASKTADTEETIKSYSIDKKDEAVKKAKEMMDNINTRADKLEQQANEKKKEWSAALAEKKAQEVAEIKKARTELSARYEHLMKASKKAWESAKEAFMKSFRKFQHKLDKVKSDTMASAEQHTAQ